MSPDGFAPVFYFDFLASVLLLGLLALIKTIKTLLLVDACNANRSRLYSPCGVMEERDSPTPCRPRY